MHPSDILTYRFQSGLKVLSIYIERSDFAGYLLARCVAGIKRCPVNWISVGLSLDKVITGLPQVVRRTRKLRNNTFLMQKLKERKE